MKNFALIGASGFIAPRHMKAIKDTGNMLSAALDPSDSVGIIDSYFPQTDFFTEYERFDRHIEKEIRNGKAIDYVSVCSPNYLHDAHIRFGLRHGADVICEKPIVLNPWNVDALESLEKETGKNVYSILQLRLHPSVIELKRKIEASPKDKHWDVDLTYLTSRGNWYYSSWKGDVKKSGGIATNIGVHFFDMLAWVFGDIRSQKVHIHAHDRASGVLELKKATVRWFLSINENLIPNELKEQGIRTYRSITIEQEEFEFSGGFTELHTASYNYILNNTGFRLRDARSAIEMVHNMRNDEVQPLVGDYHPLAAERLEPHPFFKR